MTQQIKVQAEGGEWRTAYRGRLVGGTNGLLAVTQFAAHTPWNVTHVPTGLSLGPYFHAFDDAMHAAVCVWLYFPHERLAKTTARAVTRGYPARIVQAMMGV